MKAKVRIRKRVKLLLSPQELYALAEQLQQDVREANKLPNGPSDKLRDLATKFGMASAAVYESSNIHAGKYETVMEKE